MRKTCFLFLLLLATSAVAQLGWRKPITLGKLSNVDTSGVTAGDILVWRGDKWVDSAVTAIGGAGDITGVTAGNGINGGGASGTVTINVDTTDTFRWLGPHTWSADGDSLVLNLSTAANPFDLRMNGSSIVSSDSSGNLTAVALLEGVNAVPNATNNLSFFAATTSAQLSGVLSDETGSGVAVFGTAPTLTTSNTIVADGDSLIENLGTTLYGIDLHTNSARVYAVDSTGIVLKRDVYELFAGAWDTTAANAPDIGYLDNITVYDFDQTTAETLVVDIRMPAYYVSVDSMQAEVACNSTAGDSASFRIAHRDVAVTEAYAGTYADTLTATADLGTTANVSVRLSFATALSGIAGGDRVRLKIWRDPSIADDVAADVRFVSLHLFGRGLK